MNLMQRLKQAFNPRSHDAALSHYIPAPDFSYEPVESSVWRSDNERTSPQDWRGNTGRVPKSYVMSTQGPLLFALKKGITAGLGGTSIPFGQGVTLPVTGFAGRPAQLDETSLSAEWSDIQA